MRHWTFDKADQYLLCRRYIPPNATPTFEAALDVHLCFTPNGLNPDSPESGFFLPIADAGINCRSGRPVFDAALSRIKQDSEYRQHPPIGSLSFGRGLGRGGS